MKEQEKTKYNSSEDRIYNLNPDSQGSNIIAGNEFRNNTFIGTQHNYAPEQKQNLVEAAAQIQSLLDQLSQTYSSTTTAGKMEIATKTIEQIENDPSFAERVISALKAGGVAALAQMLNHPAASFFIAALEDLRETKEI